ncbi:Two-component sensor histidine kinase, contains HisKA and HATPase domains [Cyclobacterium xiamenense]|uniref:histidine kinase n=1 Tax=Cyclobacterium xiamenense TaxID=1297121 RepID=A0A1H6U761_9BACT|nr:tetratricopeptide repeat protein [Cyclobacterium xiamenense]SEI88183.1 Two-component sensor histidine kinase, contains HisKA and HATPase domains [Cyclobacterium xiamenense]
MSTFFCALAYNKPDVDSLYITADALLNDGNYQGAISLFKELAANEQWVEELENRRKTYNNLGYAYYKIQRFDSSAIYYEKSNQAALILRDTARIIISYNSLAMDYRNLGLYSLSLEKSQMALQYAQMIDDKKKVAQIENTMAIMYASLGEVDKSFSHHLTSVSVSREIGDSVFVAYGYNNLAICFYKLGQYDSSLLYNKKALELKKILNSDSLTLASTMLNIGLDYLKLDSLQMAKDYVLRSHAIHKTLNDINGLAIGFNGLAELAIRKGDLTMAHAFLDSAYTMVNQLGFKNLLVTYYKLRIELLEKEGRFEEALTEVKLLGNLQESVFREESLKTQQVESAYLIRQKDLEAQNLTQEAALARAESRKNEQLMLFLLAGLIAAIVVAFFFFRLNRKLAESYKLIQLQKLDLKHATYNTLTRIQSMLRITSRSMPDRASKEKLHQIESAILSAASLQQFTYDIENEEAVSFGEFLEQLVSRLKDAFSSSGHSDISYSVEIYEDAILPVKTLLNCGMMVGEIVTNAVKYAFEEVEEPKIRVSLTRSGSHLLLQVGDNGVGIDAKKSREGVGTDLVRKLAKYIKAQLTVKNEGGTLYTIRLNA